MDILTERILSHGCTQHTWNPKYCQLCACLSETKSKYSIHLMRATGWKQAWSYQIDSRPTSLTWSTDGTYLIVGTETGAIKILGVHDGKIEAELQLEGEEYELSINHLLWLETDQPKHSCPFTVDLPFDNNFDMANKEIDAAVRQRVNSPFLSTTSGKRTFIIVQHTIYVTVIADVLLPIFRRIVPFEPAIEHLVQSTSTACAALSVIDERQKLLFRNFNLTFNYCDKGFINTDLLFNGIKVIMRIRQYLEYQIDRCTDLTKLPSVDEIQKQIDNFNDVSNTEQLYEAYRSKTPIDANKATQTKLHRLLSHYLMTGILHLDVEQLLCHRINSKFLLRAYNAVLESHSSIIDLLQNNFASALKCLLEVINTLELASERCRIDIENDDDYNEASLDILMKFLEQLNKARIDALQFVESMNSLKLTVMNSRRDLLTLFCWWSKIVATVSNEVSPIPDAKSFVCLAMQPTCTALLNEYFTLFAMPLNRLTQHVTENDKHRDVDINQLRMCLLRDFWLHPEYQERIKDLISDDYSIQDNKIESCRLLIAEMEAGFNENRFKYQRKSECRLLSKLSLWQSCDTLITTMKHLLIDNYNQQLNIESIQEITIAKTPNTVFYSPVFDQDTKQVKIYTMQKNQLQRFIVTRSKKIQSLDVLTKFDRIGMIKSLTVCRSGIVVMGDRCYVFFNEKSEDTKIYTDASMENFTQLYTNPKTDVLSMTNDAGDLIRCFTIMKND